MTRRTSGVPIMRDPDKMCPFYRYNKAEQMHICHNWLAEDLKTHAWITSCDRGHASDCPFYTRIMQDFGDCEMPNTGTVVRAKDAVYGQWYTTRRFNIVKVVEKELDMGKIVRVRVQLQNNITLPISPTVYLFSLEESEKPDTACLVKANGVKSVASNDVIASDKPEDVINTDVLYSSNEVPSSTQQLEDPDMPEESNTLSSPYRQKTWKGFIVETLRQTPCTTKELIAKAVAAGMFTGENAEKQARNAVLVGCSAIRKQFRAGKVTINLVRNDEHKLTIVDGA